MSSLTPSVQPDANLDHIYFFITSQPASRSQHDAQFYAPSGATAKDCPTPRTGASSLGSPRDEGTDATSTASSSTSGATSLNPLANAFMPGSTSTVTPPPTASQLYELRETRDKGYALFATAFIPSGTRIICEAPLISIPENKIHLAWGPYCRLSNAHKAAYDKLHYFKPAHLNFEHVSRVHLLDPNDDSLDDEEIEELVAEHVRVMGTFAANNFAATRGGLSVFETSSRLNHSCVPNVHHSYNPTLQKQTVHAVRDVQPSEELVTTYLGGQGNYYVQPQRSEILRQSYGFTCACPSCSDRTGDSDGRREYLANIVWGLQQFIEGSIHGGSLVPSSPVVALQQAETAIYLLIEEGLLMTELMKAYRVASTQALNLNDFAKAIEYAYNEAEVERNCLGTELDDLKKIGAASAGWIAKVRKAANAAGVNPDKPLNGRKGEKARTSEERNQKNRKKYEKKQAKKAREAAARATDEMKNAKKEYEASWPGLKK